MEKYKFVIIAPDGSRVFTSSMKLNRADVAQKDGSQHLSYWKDKYPKGSRVEVESWLKK